MLHKTLTSYHKDEPWVDDGEHPDGPLWLLTKEEYLALPENTLVQSIFGRTYRKHYEELPTTTQFESEHGYMCWGLRGHRDQY